MTATSSSYKRGQVVERTWGGHRVGRVLAVDGACILVDESRDFGWLPIWWSAYLWRPLEPLADDYHKGAKNGV